MSYLTPCIYCRQQFKSYHSLKKHQLTCDTLLSLSPDQVQDVKNNKVFRSVSQPCSFCQKECKNIQSLRTHERLCKANPNRIKSNLNITPSEVPFNRKEYNKTRPKVQCSLCGELFTSSWLSRHQKSCKSNKDIIRNCKFCNEPFGNDVFREHSKTCSKRREYIWTDERRERHSKAMTQAVINNPGSYTKSNRGRVKHIEYDGIDFHGNWELAFYKWCKGNNVSVIRNELGFEYTWDKERLYYPDFYLPELDCYVEIKGYQTDRDDCKVV